MRRLALWATTLAIAACTGDVGNPEEALQMDPRIYTTWLSVTGDDTLRSTPIVVNGLRFNEDNSTDNLAAETLTGVFKQWDPGYTTQVTRTAAGKMFLTARAGGRSYNYSVSYSASDTSLRISSSPDVWYALPEGTYDRGIEGLQVATPVPSHVSFQLNGEWHSATVVQLEPVFPTAGGFAEYADEAETQLRITALTNDMLLQITANGFSGPGTYNLAAPDSSSAVFQESSENGQLDLVSIDRSGAGTVTVASFDIATGRCSGSFTLALADSVAGSVRLFINNGTFDVPLYEDP